MAVTPATFVRPESDSPPFQPYSPYQGSLEEFDYIEEEWFVSGEEDGRPFTTVCMVRRPRDPGRFTGTVVVEPLHFFPITPLFMYVSRYLMRSGHAWAYVGSAKSAIDRVVKPSAPERYADIHIEGVPAPPGADELDLLNLPLDDENSELWWTTLDGENRATNEILAQTGAAIRAGAGPFGDLEVEHLVLVGHSYTGRLNTNFIREAHDRTRVYDGFFPSGWPMDPFGPSGVPIVQVVMDGDVSDLNSNPRRPGFDGRAYRRPDSDEPGDRFRLYELAGLGHTSTQHPPFDDLKFLEEVLDLTIPEGFGMSTLPFNELFQMALDHLIRWVADGVAPPRADRLEDEVGGRFAEDEHGNTKGGVRCAPMDVPRARYVSNVVNDDGTRSFGGNGFMAPFDAGKLRDLYGDRATYLAQVAARLDELVDQGWFLADDAEVVRADAEKVEDF